MKDYKYPKEITDENLVDLTEMAESICEDRMKSRYVLPIFVSYFGLGIPIMFGSLILMVWLLAKGYLSFLLTLPTDIAPTAFFILLLVVMGLISIPSVTILILSVPWLLRKYTNYPTHEEDIFSDCFLIANYMSGNERLKAKQQVALFLADLTSFCRDFMFNRKRKVYSPEFGLLRCGKNQISRMLMFSNNNNVPKLFRAFGLAFVREDYPTAFTNLEKIVGEVKKYGKLKGRIRSALGLMEQYPTSTPLVISTTILIMALVYYFLFGQSLPI
jgi:hypothetical protein